MPDVFYLAMNLFKDLSCNFTILSLVIKKCTHLDTSVLVYFWSCPPCSSKCTSWYPNSVVCSICVLMAVWALADFMATDFTSYPLNGKGVISITAQKQ